MSTFTVFFQTFVQGIYSLVWITILIDAGSPSFDARSFTNMSAPQATLTVALALVVAYAVGIMMHTGGRSLFHGQKERWALQVLSSPAVIQRLSDLKVDDYMRGVGGPTLQEMQASQGREQLIKSGSIKHALDYAVMARSPETYQSIQLYRNQYRLARGFILPSAALGIVLALWEPIADPFVAVQLLVLGMLFAFFAFLAFKERAYRYEAARLRAFTNLEGQRQMASKAERR